MAGLLSGDVDKVWKAVLTDFEQLKELGFFDYVFKKLAEFFEALQERYTTEKSRFELLKNLGEDLIGIIELTLAVLFVYQSGRLVTKKANDAINTPAARSLQLRSKKFRLKIGKHPPSLRVILTNFSIFE